MRIRKSHRESSLSGCAVDLLREFGLGIDLSEKFLDVKRLFMAGFAQKVVQRGLDPDDVLQEVYKGLLVRNKGKCPWDARKATLGFYVYMVSNNILSNYTRKTERRRANEVLGWRGVDGEDCDVAESLVCRADSSNPCESGTDDLSQWLLSQVDLDSDGKGRLKEIVPMLVSGHTKREISRRMGLKGKDVELILSAVRAVYA